MTTAALARLRGDVLRALAAPVRLSLPDWIESTIRQPTGGAMPGPVKLYPTQRGIADAIGDPSIERVTVLKAVRTGYSFLLAAAVASFVKNDPSRILLYLPTENFCRSLVSTDLDPMFQASPDLRGLLEYDAKAGGRNLLTERTFPGGYLKVLAAASARNFRDHTARVILMDEVDSWAPTPEGPGPTLAERRAITYRNKKIVAGSTPTSYEDGHILKMYEKSNQQEFHTPCPACGEFSCIAWADIQWDKTADGEHLPETAHCVCPSCGSIIEESSKAAMVNAGKWHAQNPSVTNHHGFKLTALTSLLPGVTWAKLATEWVGIKQVEDRRAFINTLLAEGWDDEQFGEGLDLNEIAATAEPFSIDAIPAEVLWIACGVDVGHDRLDASLIGHDADGNLFVLAHRTMYGVPANPRDEVWESLGDFLKMTWPHPLGARIGISATAIDSSDGATVDACRAFAYPRWPQRVACIRGEDGFGFPRLKDSDSKKLRGKLFLVGTWGLKDNLYARIKAKRGIRFGDTLDAKYFDELTADRRQRKRYRGREINMWVKPSGARIEAWDCLQYGWAIFDPMLVNQNPTHRQNQLRQIASAPTKPAVTRIDWLSGND